jgi:SAM-dependent methyltransferase
VDGVDATGPLSVPDTGGWFNWTPLRQDGVNLPAGQHVLKLVMDARKLTFVPDSFNTATVFFTFMYIKGPDHETVLQQIRRVLKPGGRLLIWDVNFRERPPDKEFALFRYTAQLPGRQISSGYGVRWPGGVQDLGYWVALGEKAGFEARARKDAGVWFSLELVKPRG